LDIELIWGPENRAQSWLREPGDNPLLHTQCLGGKQPQERLWNGGESDMGPLRNFSSRKFRL
jgi:hypothetical protein